MPVKLSHRLKAYDTQQELELGPIPVNIILNKLRRKRPYLLMIRITDARVAVVSQKLHFVIL